MRTSPTSGAAEIAAPSNSDGRWISVRRPARHRRRQRRRGERRGPRRRRAIARAAGRSGTSWRASTAPTERRDVVLERLHQPRRHRRPRADRARRGRQLDGRQQIAGQLRHQHARAARAAVRSWRSARAGRQNADHERDHDADAQHDRGDVGQNAAGPIVAAASASSSTTAHRTAAAVARRRRPPAA